MAEAIQRASEARRVEDAVQILRRNESPAHPRQDLGRAVPAILPVSMCPVHLVIEVDHPAIVCREQVGPGGGFSEVPIGHAALHVELRFNVGLPRLVSVDLQLGDAQRVVNTAPAWPGTHCRGR